MIFYVGSSNFNLSQFLKSFNEKSTAIIKAFALSITKLTVAALVLFSVLNSYIYSIYLRFTLRVQQYRYIDIVGASRFLRKFVPNFSVTPPPVPTGFDIIFFSVVLHIFYSPTFLGSSHIYLSNESIWIVCLLTIIVFAAKYYQLYFSDQKSNLETQIDEIKAVCLSNANLAAQINELQHSILDEQSHLLSVYYELLSTLEQGIFHPSQYREAFIRDRAIELREACYEDTRDRILKLGSLVLQIEDFILISELNETSEEIISQFIESHNNLYYV